MNVLSCFRLSCCFSVITASFHKARTYSRINQLWSDFLRTRKIKFASLHAHGIIPIQEVISLWELRRLQSFHSSSAMAKKSTSVNKSSSKVSRAKKTAGTTNAKEETLKVVTETSLKRKQDPKSTPAKKIKTSKSESFEEQDTDVEGNNTIESCGDFISRINQQRETVCESVAKFKFNKKRVRVITKTEDFSPNSNGVLYWMSRDQRVQDNWAFLYAQRLAMKLEVPLYVSFCLVPTFLDATIRHFKFMMKGLAQVEKECRELNIPFCLLLGEASTAIPAFLKKFNIGGVVTDFSPLRTPIKWLNDLKNALPEEVPLCQVDAHNLVPCWEASPKLEYAARTIRTKIHNQLGQFLTEFPPLVKHPHPPNKMPEAIDWIAADSFLTVDRSVEEVAWAIPGTEHGLRMLESFCESRLKEFSTLRNDPTKQALSNLSPWLHFGQLSAQRCILTVRTYRSKYNESVNAFIEEAVIRRELADNFCFYNEKYDSVTGAYEWAQKSLDIHRNDKRPYLYTREQLEQGKTHDTLWNAAQIQMVREGKMHGFLRMYWAKKILEWTKSPEEALSEAIYLNDKYNLDGRDPNGYVGCMWSICGMHDHPWTERAVFGKVRYMNYNGCKRKFKVEIFITQNNKSQT